MPIRIFFNSLWVNFFFLFPFFIFSMKVEKEEESFEVGTYFRLFPVFFIPSTWAASHAQMWSTFCHSTQTSCSLSHKYYTRLELINVAEDDFLFNRFKNYESLTTQKFLFSAITLSIFLLMWHCSCHSSYAY